MITITDFFIPPPPLYLMLQLAAAAPELCMLLFMQLLKIMLLIRVVIVIRIMVNDWTYPQKLRLTQLISIMGSGGKRPFHELPRLRRQFLALSLRLESLYL